MPSDKASYLAEHYLTADLKPSKKRKRKHAPSSSSANGLLIQDDDEPGWTKPSTTHNDDDPDIPMTIAGTSAEFRRAKKSAWKTLSKPPEDDDTAAAADAIIASAAAEQAAAARLADGDPDPDPGPEPSAASVPMMSDGTHAGLQSAKAITAQLRIRKEAEQAELARMNAERAAAGDKADETEVVLRDATGRRVDAAMRRAEMRRAAAEAERAEEERRRALKGEVQLEQARKRKEALEEAALMPLARGKDDVEMNRELKAERRWNDPMAEFMGDDATEKSVRARTKRESRRPVYKGAAPPNRYGIKPGYRWDGVDRGNGFEAERFKGINRRERNKGLDYAWQMDE